jgi:hypothetical protein
MCLKQEMCVDFRKIKVDETASLIHDEPVEIFDTFKYLGTIFDNKLKFDANTEHIVKRGQ